MPACLRVIVPLFNEADNVPRLLSSIADSSRELVSAAGSDDLKVLCVDDGSRDGTHERLASMCLPFGLTVLRHGINRGPGASFGTAFAHLSAELDPSDLLITMEGDNTSRLDTAAKMLVRIREGHDAVLASPYAYGGGFSNTSAARLLLSHGANSVLKGIVGVHGIHTMSSFFRLYTGGLIARLQGTFGMRILERNGFECMAELLVKMMLIRASISEIAMHLNSGERLGSSKMNVGRTIKGYMSIVRARRRWERQAGARLWTYSRA